MPTPAPRPDAIDFAVALRRPGASAALPLALVNERTDKVLADVVELAITRQSRNQGLLGRDELPVSAGMVLAPCFSIHTAFMRFPIDAAFIDRGGRVVTMVHTLKAWRMALSPRAYAVVELPAGTLLRRDVAAGDRLYFVPRTSGAPPAARESDAGR